MRNKKMYAVMQRLNDIEAIWDARNSVDCLDEPEFEEYEKLLMCLAEFVCR